MSSDNILSSNSKLKNTKLKFNLAYRIICEARKIGFSFQESSAYEDNIEIAGTSILSLLEKKEIARYRESNHLNIFMLEQLISREGNILLTWQQVRDIRGLKSKGRKPNWFKIIEEKVLCNNNARKIKEVYRVIAPNQNALIYTKQRISPDKRKKEWIISEKEKSIVLGRVIKKDRKHICLEHWQIEATSKEENTIAKKCSGYIARKCNDTNCLVRLKNDSWHQVIGKIHNNNESLRIKAPLSAYREAKEIFNGEIAANMRRVEISLVGLEEAIIQRVIKNE